MRKQNFRGNSQHPRPQKKQKLNKLLNAADPSQQSPGKNQTEASSIIAHHYN
jgi:hypothetical protein